MTHRQAGTATFQNLPPACRSHPHPNSSPPGPGGGQGVPAPGSSLPAWPGHTPLRPLGCSLHGLRALLWPVPTPQGSKAVVSAHSRSPTHHPSPLTPTLQGCLLPYPRIQPPVPQKHRTASWVLGPLPLRACISRRDPKGPLKPARTDSDHRGLSKPRARRGVAPKQTGTQSSFKRHRGFTRCSGAQSPSGGLPQPGQWGCVGLLRHHLPWCHPQGAGVTRAMPVTDHEVQNHTGAAVTRKPPPGLRDFPPPETMLICAFSGLPPGQAGDPDAITGVS